MFRFHIIHVRGHLCCFHVGLGDLTDTSGVAGSGALSPALAACVLDPAEARFYLEESGYDLNKAWRAYMDDLEWEKDHPFAESQMAATLVHATAATSTSSSASAHYSAAVLSTSSSPSLSTDSIPSFASLSSKTTLPRARRRRPAAPSSSLTNGLLANDDASEIELLGRNKSTGRKS
jgi:hypothetical protein